MEQEYIIRFLRAACHGSAVSPYPWFSRKEWTSKQRLAVRRFILATNYVAPHNRYRTSV